MMENNPNIDMLDVSRLQAIGADIDEFVRQQASNPFLTLANFVEEQAMRLESAHSGSSQDERRRRNDEETKLEGLELLTEQERREYQEWHRDWVNKDYSKIENFTDFINEMEDDKKYAFLNDPENSKLKDQQSLALAKGALNESGEIKPEYKEAMENAGVAGERTMGMINNAKWLFATDKNLAQEENQIPYYNSFTPEERQALINLREKYENSTSVNERANLSKEAERIISNREAAQTRGTEVTFSDNKKSNDSFDQIFGSDILNANKAENVSNSTGAVQVTDSSSVSQGAVRSS